MGGTAVASRATSVVLNRLVEDDATKMLKIVEAALADLGSVYLLSEREAENVVEKLKQCGDLGTRLQEMFAAGDRSDYAMLWLRPLVEDEVKARKKVRAQFARSMAGAMEEIELN